MLTFAHAISHFEELEATETAKREARAPDSVTLAFYRAEYGGLLSKLIAWASGGAYSHVEFVFPNNLSISSRESGGVQIKQIFYDPQQWDFCRVPCDTHRLWRFCYEKVGLKYDWAGVIGYLPRFKDLQDQNKWYCSELMVRALQHVGVLQGENALAHSPNSLHSLLTTQGYTWELK